MKKLTMLIIISAQAAFATGNGDIGSADMSEFDQHFARNRQEFQSAEKTLKKLATPSIIVKVLEQSKLASVSNIEIKMYDNFCGFGNTIVGSATPGTAQPYACKAVRTFRYFAILKAHINEAESFAIKTSNKYPEQVLEIIPSTTGSILVVESNLTGQDVRYNEARR